MKLVKLLLTGLLLAGAAGAQVTFTPSIPSGNIAIYCTANGVCTTNGEDFQTRGMASTAILYGQDGEGSMRMACTATAYAKVPGGYLFVTASHCVSTQTKDTDAGDMYYGSNGVFFNTATTITFGAPSEPRLKTLEEKIRLDPSTFYITFDSTGEKKFLRAEVLIAGLQRLGDDFAILRVKTTETFTTIPLGDESKEQMGNEVINFASPQGLGRQLMKGYISMPRLDRPVKEGSINWQDSIVLQISAGPGSSGSSILSLNQEAIIGFLVGTVADKNVIAIPVSRFKTFSHKVNKNEYQYYPAELRPSDMPTLPE